MKSLITVFSTIVAILLCLPVPYAYGALEFTVLTEFNESGGAYANGAEPRGRLAEGTDGSFYGVTRRGGSHDCGTVFRVTPTGALTMLHSFTGADGAFPMAGLVSGVDGNLYGTTSSGGMHSGGTIFRITPDGVFTILVAFPEGGPGPHKPEAGMVRGADNNFYGTIPTLGDDARPGISVFRLTPEGQFTVLHSFQTVPAGFPAADGSMQEMTSTLHDTASGGGSAILDNLLTGYGKVFKITADGAFALLHSFDGSNDSGTLDRVGFAPNGALAADGEGNFYGTTRNGGEKTDSCDLGCGTVFRITPEGKLTTIHEFSAESDGIHPETGLVPGPDGNLYGTTSGGGWGAHGTIFKITTDGAVATLFTAGDSSGCGGHPNEMILAGDGNLYGTTRAMQTGTAGGTVFRISGLTPPSGPLISALAPTSGTAGTVASIKGRNFGPARESSFVTFNGVPVTGYISWSETVIKCAVPDGATTGPVVVTTAAGTSPGKTFTVHPPTIAALSPAAGTAGTVVAVKGKHFGPVQGSSSVTFNGVPVTAYTSWSDTVIKCAVPDGATTGPVTVRTSVGTSAEKTFTVHLPTIAALSPAAGTAGTAVTVKGKYFGPVQGSSSVTFNGVPVTAYASWSDTVIKCTVPSGVTTGPVVVRTSVGTSAGKTFTVHLPSITSLTPAAGTAGTVLTVKGKYFGPVQGSSSVTFNGVPVTAYASWSDKAIKCTVPGGVTTGPVTVRTSVGDSPGKTFTMSPPSITSLSPASGTAGTVVTVKGKYFGPFQGSSSVTFNGVPVIAYASWSDTAITCTVPSGVTTGPVVVRTSVGTSSGKTFTLKQGSGRITYAGLTTQAHLTAANANLLFAKFWNGGSSTGSFPASSRAAKAAPSIKSRVGEFATLAKRLATAINETQTGSVSGTLHIKGNINPYTGTGTLTLTYTNFNDGDGSTYDGTVTLRSLETALTMSFTLWTIKSAGSDVSLSGSMRVQLDEQSSSEVLTINLDGRDNLARETFRFQNVAVSSPLTQVLSETYSGRLYSEKHGFVEIGTVSPFIYTEPELDPSSGGPIILAGAGNSSARITPISPNYVKIEVDENGDGTYENKNVYAWNNLSGAAVNVAISITVTPANPGIPNGTAQQFTATGLFVDDSSQDLTSLVTWTSSNTAIATINSAGLATGVGVGAATITATSGDFSGSAALAVTPAVLVSLAISPQNKTLLKRTSQQFVASGTFSDHGIQDVTSSVNWDSSDISVATISNTADTYGRAAAVKSGSTVITAASGKISVMTTLRVADWTLQPERLPSYLYSVIWNGAQFVAVGTGPTIHTSPDGVTWNRQTSGVTTTSDLMDVTWSGTQFIAVGGLMSNDLSAAILTSPDGLTWSQRSSNFLTHLSGVACSNTLCVAAGGNGTILTSPDGIAWTPRDSAAPNAQLTDVVWSGSQFVVVGNGAIVTSPDGITWTRRADIPINLNGVVWSGTQFVAVGNGIFTSADGITWTQRDSSSANSISWSGSQYAAVGGGWSSGLILASPDGVTWTSQTFDSTMILQSVAWGGNHFVAVGAGGVIVTSP